MFVQVNTLNSNQQRKRRASEEKQPSSLDNPEKKPATTMLKSIIYQQPQSRLQKMTADIISHPGNFFSPYPTPKQQLQQPSPPLKQPHSALFQPPASLPPLGGDEVDDAETMDFRFEQARLDSFENWPVTYISTADLAAAGFYYTKQIDRVRCFECNAEICRWEEGDIPMTEHQRWGGRCRFIRKLPCGNVPIGVDPSTIPMPRPRSEDVCGPYRLDYRLNSEDDTNASSSTINHPNLLTRSGTQLPSAAKLGCLGIGIPKRPNFPEYATYEARLQTFEDWPASLPQKKEDLANAGFFYTKTGDQTTCFSCGGGLKNWEPHDDPWVQHAKWFSCYYVLLVKGQEFINQVTGKPVQPPTEEETKQMNLPSCIKKVEITVPEQPQPPVKESAEEINPEPNSPTESMETNSNPGDTETIKSSQLSTGSSEESTSTCTTNNSKKSIDDARTCKICYSEELGVVFLPCGHMVSCVKCAPGMTACAVCREPVAMTVRAFFS